MCIYIHIQREGINDGIQVTESTFASRCSYAALSAQNVKCAFKLNSLMNSQQRLTTNHQPEHRLKQTALKGVAQCDALRFLSDYKLCI